MTMQVLSKVGGAGALVVGIPDQLLLGTDGSVVLGQDATTGARTLQVATMKKFADEFTSLKTGSGWQKLPSGLIVQWFTASNANNGGSGLTITNLPLAFPTAALAVCGMGIASSAGSYAAGQANSVSVTATQLTWTAYTGNGTLQASANALAVNFLVVGY